MFALNGFALIGYVMKLRNDRYLLWYLTLFMLAFALIFPYSFWSKLCSGFIEYKKLANFKSLIKSSTIYVIIQKCVWGSTISDCSSLGCFKEQQSDDYASRYGYIHSLISSQQGRISDNVKFADVDRVKSRSKFT